MSYTPEQINFNTTKPLGFPSTIKIQRWQPMGSFGSIQNTDQVRFKFNTDGYLDPYMTYINLEVAFDDMDAESVIQLDHSAHSFINQFVCYNKGKEIERIMQYDVLAGILGDVQLSPEQRHKMQNMGYGYCTALNVKPDFGSYKSRQLFAYLSRSNQPTITYGSQQPLYGMSAGYGWGAGNVASWTTASYVNSNAFMYSCSNVPEDEPFVSGNTTLRKIYPINTNAITIGTPLVNVLEFSKDLTGLVGGSRTRDYLGNTAMALVSGDYPAAQLINISFVDTDAWGSYQKLGIWATNQGALPTQNNIPVPNRSFRHLKNEFDALQCTQFSGVTNASGQTNTPENWNWTDTSLKYWSNFGFLGENVSINGKVLLPNSSGRGIEATGQSRLDNLPIQNFLNQIFTYGLDMSHLGQGVDAQLRGPQFPYSFSLSGGSFEPLHSTTFKQNVIANGRPSRQVVSKGKWTIPLLSGIFGILMPKSSYKYIPMEAFDDTIWEFTINPHAVVTSGYSDYNSAYTPPNNFTTQNKRQFTITKFEIVTETVRFSSDIESILRQQLISEAGVVLHTCSWFLGPIYNITANQIPNTMQINLGFDSLKSILVCFLSSDYRQYSWCRKQFRLSHNITKFQIRVGTSYFPALPIVGHGGNNVPYTNNYLYPSDNSEFLINLQKAFGKFHDINGDSFINNTNFAINDRCYNPANNTPLGKYTGTANPLQTTSLATIDVNWAINNDTACGYALFNENRCVGRAVYGLNLETLDYDNKVLSGINTNLYRPFELLFEADMTSPYLRNSEALVFCYYDMVVKIQMGEITTYGRT